MAKSAISGRFVTKKHAKRSPRTTFMQRVPIGRKRRGKRK